MKILPLLLCCALCVRVAQGKPVELKGAAQQSVSPYYPENGNYLAAIANISRLLYDVRPQRTLLNYGQVVRHNRHHFKSDKAFATYRDFLFSYDNGVANQQFRHYPDSIMILERDKGQVKAKILFLSRIKNPEGFYPRAFIVEAVFRLNEKHTRLHIHEFKITHVHK